MRQTLQSVQIFSAHISVVVISKDEEDISLSIRNLVSLATILMIIWHIQMIPNRIRFEILTMVSDIRRALIVIGTLLTIGVNSLAWGMLNV